MRSLKLYSMFHNFQIDYNLYGMGHLHISKMKFRHPVPDVYSHQNVKYNGKLRTSRDDSTCIDFQFRGVPFAESSDWVLNLDLIQAML